MASRWLVGEVKRQSKSHLDRIEIHHLPSVNRVARAHFHVEINFRRQIVQSAVANTPPQTTTHTTIQIKTFVGLI